MTEHDDNAMQPVSDQAAEWFIRLRDRDLTVAERRKYVRWLKQSPNHIAEFMRLCRLYGRVKRAELPTLAAEADDSNVIALLQGEIRAPVERRPAWFDSRELRLAVVACCLALVGVVATIAFSSNTIETDAGEWRTVQLADGSLVSTGPNTLMQVDYSKETRRINLARGEAVFKVTKDPSRPFIVNAGGAIARAVGTRFGVERREDRIRVTVAEGKVAVVRGDQAAALEHAVDLTVATALVADEGLDIPVNAPTVPLRKEKVNSAQALAWANGQLFLQTTVGEAVEEFNRRNRLQLRVDDPAIAGMHVCCSFDAADPEAFAKQITDVGHRLGQDVVLVREGNTLRLVQQQEPGQAVPPETNPVP
ncbi:MAG TPA: FecR domain-containing protein [Steroidobacteraceae bacterium]|jgi:transmembrane sensor|nr:FecR domain-containing protein [Steroidobacteraceae bacterium]